MISVIISTLDSETELPHTLAALVPAAADGAVREVVVVDGGSSDRTEQVADAAGCTWLDGPGTRGARWSLGASHARRGDWMLFLPSNAVLEAGWHHEVQSFIDRAERSGAADRLAAAFRLRFDAFGAGPRLAETFAAARSQLLGMPYGNQGLLAHRRLYDRIGGHRPLPTLEDMDIAKRIGRSRITCLRSAAVSPAPDAPASLVMAARQWIARFCVGTLRVPPHLVLKLHG